MVLSSKCTVNTEQTNTCHDDYYISIEILHQTLTVAIWLANKMLSLMDGLVLKKVRK